MDFPPSAGSAHVAWYPPLVLEQFDVAERAAPVRVFQPVVVDGSNQRGIYALEGQIGDEDGEGALGYWVSEEKG